MPDALADAAPLYCPGCGFDLRATPGNRCGECGLEFDRAATAVSAIPWAHRRRIGRTIAYLKTARAFLFDHRSLHHEITRPQDPKDARSFARVTAAAVATALLLAYGAVLLQMRSMAFLAVGPPNFGERAPASADFTVPWSAGIMIPLLPPICLILLAFWICGAQRFIFRAGSTRETKLRAFCIGHYLTAPLVQALPAVLLLAGARTLASLLADDPSRSAPLFLLVPEIAGALVLLIALLMTFARTLQWLIRLRQCGGIRAGLLAMEWLGLLLLGIVVILALIPWFAGFIRIVIDALS